MNAKKLPVVVSLVGMSGVGKSHISQSLEDEYNYKRISIDDIIARALKLDDVSGVAQWLGEPHQTGYFDRQNHYLHLEEQALELVLATLEEGQRTVIDTTGSVVFLSAPIRREMGAKTTVVLLENTQKDINQMVLEYVQNPKPVIWRNYYAGDLESSYKKLLSVRKRLYSDVADIRVDVSTVSTTDEFIEAVCHAKSWPYESYLQHHVLPILERGRPNWDRPHTEAVVRMVKKIINENQALQVNPHVLIVTAYLHDYGYSELHKGTEPLYPVDALKRMHAKHSRDKWISIQNENEFRFLKPEEKERIAHLIEVHDELGKLQDVDELVFMEADTLGALETSLTERGWQGSQLNSYLRSVKKRRLPLFLNDSSKHEAKKIIKKLYKKIGWFKRFLG